MATPEAGGQASGMGRTRATEAQIQGLALAIESQAAAIAEGRLVGPMYAAVVRLRENVDTLAVWARGCDCASVSCDRCRGGES